jgi:DNA-binding CsgD family transcriptional regulator
LIHQFNSGVPGHAQALTGREREVVQLIAEGNSNKMVARALDITVKTVETHRATAMRKLSLGSTAALVRYAIRARLTIDRETPAHGMVSAGVPGSASTKLRRQPECASAPNAIMCD